MNLSQKTDLINRIASMTGPVTLNGEPALIHSLASDVLTIETKREPRKRATATWEAVERILDAGGEFRT